MSLTAGFTDVEPIVANTTMQVYTNSNNVQLVYQIRPADGYVLHDSRKDYTDIDPETNEEITFEGFTRAFVSVPVSYDFEANPYNIYAALENEVPADQIFGGGTTEPEHEVM